MSEFEVDLDESLDHSLGGQQIATSNHKDLQIRESDGLLSSEEEIVKSSWMDRYPLLGKMWIVVCIDETVLFYASGWLFLCPLTRSPRC
jgi:hypothetical protein